MKLKNRKLSSNWNFRSIFFIFKNVFPASFSSTLNLSKKSLSFSIHFFR
jgi:hypothetical protein